eukprot:1161984-Pelagomonas_calceolata.AAC.8
MAGHMLYASGRMGPQVRGALDKSCTLHMACVAGRVRGALDKSCTLHMACVAGRVRGALDKSCTLHMACVAGRDVITGACGTEQVMHTSHGMCGMARRDHRHMAGRSASNGSTASRTGLNGHNAIAKVYGRTSTRPMAKSNHMGVAGQIWKAHHANSRVHMTLHDQSPHTATITLLGCLIQHTRTQCTPDKPQ